MTFQASWPKSRFLKLRIKGRELLARSPLDALARAAIHPASYHHKRKEGLRKGIKRHIVHFKTPDGQQIEALWFKRSDKGDPAAIVCGLGNAMSLEDREFFLENFHHVHADLLIPNYRGVGDSTGTTSPLGLALDIYSAGEYLVSQGYDPSRIIFYGTSLGGYTATKGAAFFQKKHKHAKVSVINDRSFSSLACAALHLSGFFSSLLSRMIGWNLNATGVWRDFLGKKLVLFHKQDFLYPSSFLHKVAHIPRTERIELTSTALSALEAHEARFSRQEIALVKHFIDSILNK